MPTIKSNQITFVDITDSRKLDVYITSNLPTTQIYDSNAGTYSPDWSITNLQLIADIYLDSEIVTPETIEWYTRINTTETFIKSGYNLNITTNVLSSNPIITYICRVTYQNLQAYKEVTFMRADAGLNGSNGKDGTSVNILGSYNTLSDLQTAHPTGNAGDAYIVDGDLYVWTADNAQWENVGNIQGPEGKAGESAKSIILNASAHIFKIDEDETLSPKTITVTAQTFNTSVNDWTYSVNGGKTFLSTAPTGVSRNGNIVTITGLTLESNSIVIRASDGTYSDTLTVYKVFDGTNGDKGDDGDPAPIAFLTNENVTFGANENGQIANMAFTTNVVAYNGTTKVTPTIGTISKLPTGMTVGSPTTMGNEIILTFTIDKDATLDSASSNNGEITIPVTSPINTNLKLSWSKVNSGLKGDAGVGIKSTTVTYGVSDSASVQPGDDEWQSDIPVVDEGMYLWTRTIIDYTDESIPDTVTYIYAKQGIKGDTGSSGSSVAISSIQYQEGSSATTAPTDTWSNSVVTVAEGKYLWTKTAFSDGKTAYGVARQGANGAKGDAGIPAVSFQIYAPNGYILTKDLSEITLQTFAYEGSNAITSGATYQWAQYVDDVWENISGATSASYTITQTDVLKSKSYRCIMTYKSQTYISTVTVQDKTDVYNSIMCISSNATSNDCYWVLYTLVYSDTEEVDPLLGPIAVSAPTSPENGDYWYAVDTINATVTLKKYNGTNWVNSTDKQSLSYYWDMIDDGSRQTPLGDSAKVKVVSCRDFTATVTLVCEVSNVEDGLLTQSSLSITDASDPIVSETEPTVAVNGQIWIKPNSNGTYLMFVWDASLNNWISSDMDTRNKVYTSRPSSYNAGDLWITASDTDHGTYLHGTLLQAQKTNIVYNASDWSSTLRYDQDIDDMKNTLNNLSQYVTITSAGLRIGARSSSGELSPFTSLFTSTELSFYQNSEKLLTLANNKLTAPRIEVENDLIVQGSIGLGDLKLIIESNGSFSFAVQK